MDEPEFDDGLELSRNPVRIERILQHISSTSPFALPDCMRRTRFDCSNCELAHPSRCLIALDPGFASYLQYRINSDIQLRRVIRRVIKEHGRPMFWDIIAAMVQVRHPHVSRQVIYSVLSRCSADFAAINRGVYGLAEWHNQSSRG